MAKTDVKTIDDYHRRFPEEQQERMQQIRALIHQVAPDVSEVISYQIPAFKLGKHFLIYYSTYAKHLSLSSPWTAALLCAFAAELKAYKVSKSAIQLPHDQPLPLDLIKALLQFRQQELGA